MKFLFLYLGTIGITYVITLLLKLLIDKGLAKQGYKCKENTSFKLSFEFIIMFFIPIINILYAFTSLLIFLTSESISDYVNPNCLEEMTELEKEEYSRMPTGINAMLVSKKVKKRLNNAMILLYRKDKDASKILFEYNNNPRKTKILQINGPLSELSVEEQELVIIKAIEKAVKIEIMEIGIKNFKKEIKKRLL